MANFKQAFVEFILEVFEFMHVFHTALCGLGASN